MLKVENISSGYGKKQVLFNISFELATGEIMLMTGGNGSGKSTILKCIYGLLPLWDGEIYFKEKTEFKNYILTISICVQKNNIVYEGAALEQGRNIVAQKKRYFEVRIFIFQVLQRGSK